MPLTERTPADNTPVDHDAAGRDLMPVHEEYTLWESRVCGGPEQAAGVRPNSPAPSGPKGWVGGECL